MTNSGSGENLKANFSPFENAFTRKLSKDSQKNVFTFDRVFNPFKLKSHFG